MIAFRLPVRGARGRNDEQPFVARYEKGAPWDGYTDQEVLDRYRPLVSQLAPAEFEEAARISLDRLTRQDRLLLGQYLQRQAEWHGVKIAAAPEDEEHRMRDADFLAQTITDIHRREPALLEALMGVEGSTVDSPLTKAVLAGIVAVGTKDAPVPAGR
ncbi:MAG: hypothetical protein ACRDG4_14535 [Chloroflexota bacterium]